MNYHIIKDCYEIIKIFGHQDTFDNWNTEKLKLLERGADARALKNHLYQM